MTTKQYLTLTVNFPDSREHADIDCGELNHDLSWEEQVEAACEVAQIALASGNGPEWSSMVLVVTNSKA